MRKIKDTSVQGTLTVLESPPVGDAGIFWLEKIPGAAEIPGTPGVPGYKSGTLKLPGMTGVLDVTLPENSPVKLIMWYGDGSGSISMDSGTYAGFVYWSTANETDYGTLVDLLNTFLSSNGGGSAAFSVPADASVLSPSGGYAISTAYESVGTQASISEAGRVSSATRLFAQKIVLGSTSPINELNLQVRLSPSSVLSGTTGSFIYKLYPDNAGAPDTSSDPIAVSTSIDLSTITMGAGGSYGIYTAFDVGAVDQLSAGTYWVVMEISGHTPGSNDDDSLHIDLRETMGDPALYWDGAAWQSLGAEIGGQVYSSSNTEATILETTASIPEIPTIPAVPDKVAFKYRSEFGEEDVPMSIPGANEALTEHPASPTAGQFWTLRTPPVVGSKSGDVQFPGMAGVINIALPETSVLRSIVFYLDDANGGPSTAIDIGADGNGDEGQMYVHVSAAQTLSALIAQINGEIETTYGVEDALSLSNPADGTLTFAATYEDIEFYTYNAGSGGGGKGGSAGVEITNVNHKVAMRIDFDPDFDIDEFSVFMSTVDASNPSGRMKVRVCPDNAGVPDLETTLTRAGDIDLANAGDFDSVNPHVVWSAFEKATLTTGRYWVVFEFEGYDPNVSTLKLNYGNTGLAPSSDQAFYWDGATWTALEASIRGAYHHQNGTYPMAVLVTPSADEQLSLNMRGSDGTKSLIIPGSGTLATQTYVQAQVAAGAVDLGAIAEDIIPDADVTRSLGAADKSFANLYVNSVTSPAGQGLNISAQGTALSLGNGSASIDAYAQLNAFADILPGTEFSRYLGNSTYRWQGVYTRNVFGLSAPSNQTDAAIKATSDLAHYLPFRLSGLALPTAYYIFEYDTFNGGSNNEGQDLLGNNNLSPGVATVSLVDGGVDGGWAASFNGTTSRFFNGNNLSWGTPLSIAFWMKPSTTDGGKVIVHLGDPATNIAAFIIATDSIKIYTSAGVLMKHYQGIPVTTDWAHMAFVYNHTGSVLTVYKNGVDITSSLTKTVDGTGIVPTNPRPITVGAQCTNLSGPTFSNFYAGLLDHLGFWSNKLSQNAVKLHMSSTRRFQPDGSVPMRGTLDMGAFRVLNMATPTQATDAATKGYVDANAAVWNKEIVTLSAQNITDQYVDLDYEIKAGSLDFMVGGVLMAETEDYSISTAGSVSRVTFLGILATGGQSELVAGNKVYFKYQR